MSDMFRTERTAVMATAMQQSPAWPVVFNAGSALTLAEAAYDAVAPGRFSVRQDELLDANNRYLERARVLTWAVAAAAGQLEFNAKHLIAEDDLADALHTVDVAQSTMRDIATELRQGMAKASDHGALMPISAQANLRQTIRTALGHIEHMAAWIGQQNAGYSFESLGEDIEAIRSASAEHGI